ncbi:hypothetical protein ACWEQP_35760 [Streptomyces sp. NPDC004044]
MSSLMAFFDPFGAVPGSSLNWSQHAALQSSAARSVTAVPSAVPVINTARIEAELKSVGAITSQVVESVNSLESELGLQLEAQTESLGQQTELLAEVAHTLHNPAHTRAAEQLRDATELLRHSRYERALSVAHQAIENDPNNDTAFMAAGWACRGLERPEEARDFFREAAEATEFTRPQDLATAERHVHSVLLAARLTFALEGPQAAMSELASLEPDRYPAEASAAIRFDRTIYLAASHEDTSAIDNFRKAADEDPRFCLMALTDPVIASNRQVYAAVFLELHHRKQLVDSIHELLRPSEEYLRELRARLQRYELLGDPGIQEWLNHQIAAILTPDSEYRRNVFNNELQRVGGSRLRDGYLERGPDTIKKYFGGFEAAAAPLIDNEIAREEILADAISRELSIRRTRRLYRGRVEAILGRRGIRTSFKYDFWRIMIDLNGRENVTTLQPTEKLIRGYREAGR